MGFYLCYTASNEPSMIDERRTAHPLTEADLLQASLITERDKVEDVAWWKTHGSPLTNRLLDAAPADDGR
ncbi:MAG TPA: hypothetical protein VGP44_12815 [Gemmatimonadales bacterium]|nr:hypothetical protein [Gemmatimonadales bacterium]